MNTAANAGAAPAREPGFQLTRELQAPRALVFRAWTESLRLRRWWAPRELSIIGIANDLRPGGRCHYGLRAANGLETWGLWIYREVLAPEQLVFIASFADAKANAIRHPIAADWPREILTTVELAEQPGGTLLTLSAAPHAATPAERQAFRDGLASIATGWNARLGALADYLSTYPLV